MASMAISMYEADIPFGEVGEGVDFVRVGVQRANRWAGIFRIAFKAVVLTADFTATLERQEVLIEKLNGPILQRASVTDLLELAGRIDHLVELNDNLLDNTSPRDTSVPGYGFWVKLFDRARQQRNNLASIAESFRCAADYEAVALLGLTLEGVEG